jgi:hypothetical protein
MGPADEVNDYKDGIGTGYHSSSQSLWMWGPLLLLNRVPWTPHTNVVVLLCKVNWEDT